MLFAVRHVPVSAFYHPCKPSSHQASPFFFSSSSLGEAALCISTSGVMFWLRDGVLCLWLLFCVFFLSHLKLVLFLFLVWFCLLSLLGCFCVCLAVPQFLLTTFSLLFSSFSLFVPLFFSPSPTSFPPLSPLFPPSYSFFTPIADTTLSPT